MADGDRCLNQLELLTLNISKFEIVFSVYGEAIFLFIRLEREHFNKYIWELNLRAGQLNLRGYYFRKTSCIFGTYVGGYLYF